MTYELKLPILVSNNTKETLNNSAQIPYQGEIVFERDTNKLKIGNGVNTYNDLKYLGAGDFEVVRVTPEDSPYTTTKEKELLLIQANDLINIEISSDTTDLIIVDALENFSNFPVKLDFTSQNFMAKPSVELEIDYGGTISLKKTDNTFGWQIISVLGDLIKESEGEDCFFIFNGTSGVSEIQPNKFEMTSENQVIEGLNIEIPQNLVTTPNGYGLVKTFFMKVTFPNGYDASSFTQDSVITANDSQNSVYSTEIIKNVFDSSSNVYFSVDSTQSDVGSFNYTGDNGGGFSDFEEDATKFDIRLEFNQANLVPGIIIEFLTKQEDLKETYDEEPQNYKFGDLQDMCSEVYYEDWFYNPW